MLLRADNWTAGNPSDREILDPTWEVVEQAIHALDQRQRTQLVLDRQDGSHMLIGGGGGRYNVCVTKPRGEDEDYLTLVDDTAPPNGHENLVTGGQLGRFPARTVVALDYAITAAKAFFRDGSLAGDLSWLSE
jgi:hypothetical protein